MQTTTTNTFKSRFTAWLSSLVNPVILLAYCYITVLTPRLDAFDSAGTKFLALAILNLVVFIFLQFRKDQQPPLRIFSAFFSRRIGLLYGLFLAVTLLSFVKAVNPAESLLAFTKIFTVFTAVMIIAAILRFNSKYITLVAISMTLLLLYDAATVFYQMYGLLEKYPKFTDLYASFINEVKTDYSNKNILSSALFVKLPFALYLWTFKKGALKILGLLATFIGMMAMMPLSTRAFYIGLILLATVYLVFLIVRFLVDRKRWKSAIFSMIIVVLIPLFIYAGWRGLSHYFPEAGMFNLKDKITERLETIKGDMARFATWKRTVTLYKEEPVFGVGIGNWKINILKYESAAIPDYTYYYYNHNDFLQTAAETGIVGGLLFLSLFIAMGWAFILALFKGTASGMTYEYLFIPAFGLLCYSVDASFNFPFDRPEIQSLWAIFLGAAVAFTPENKAILALAGWFKVQSLKFEVQRSRFFPASRVPHPGFSSRNIIAPTLYLILLFGSIWLLYQNFRSLQLQALVRFELLNNELRTPSSVFMTGFPSIPTLSVESEPIALMKARYLINEGKLAQAIELLKKDRSSPWETRREVFISRAYMDLGNSDSALAYARRVYELKPLFRDNLQLLLAVLEQKELYAEGVKILDAFIASGYADQNIVDRRAAFDRKTKIQRVEAAWYMGKNFYDRKSYKEAESRFTEVINKEPDLLEAYDYRAFCRFNLKEYRKSMDDVEHLIASGNKDPKIVNLQQELKKVIR